MRIQLILFNRWLLLFSDSVLDIDAELLRDLSQGSVAEDKLNILAQQQLKELTHAMQCKCLFTVKD